MHFLNDKFFRFTVIVFFILMVLPFMFSSPQKPPENDENYLEYTDTNPIYKIINRVAEFYGLKKKENFALPNSKIENIKKQMAEQKEGKEKDLNTATQTQSKSLEDKQAISQDGKKQEATSPNNTNTSNLNGETNKYFGSSAAFNQSPANQENRHYQGASNREPNLSSALAKKRNFIQAKKAREEMSKEQKSSLSEVYGENKSLSAKTLTDRESLSSANKTVNKNAKQSKIYSKKGKLSSQNSFGQSYFGNESATSGDLFENIENISGMQNHKENKKQAEKTASAPITRTYRVETVNPSTGKKQEITVQKQITKEDIVQSKDIKQITVQNLKEEDYNSNTIMLENTSKTIPIPTEKDSEIIDVKAGILPHTIIDEMPKDDGFDENFTKTYQKAKDALPSSQEKYPMLEFVSGTKEGKVLRADNESFNVVAIKKLLADKVAISKEEYIAFEDIKDRIYVVPEERIYQEYLSRKVPVIYYPQLSPLYLKKAYETASEAIDTFNANQQQTSIKEQKQKETEIEEALKND